MMRLMQRLRWLLIAPIFLAACVGTAGLGLVGRVRMDGQGRVWTDGNALFATGAYSGDAMVYVQGSGLGVTIPVSVVEGEAYLYNRALDVKEHRSLELPMPLWVKELLLEGEADDVGITFLPEALPPPADDQPPSESLGS